MKNDWTKKILAVPILAGALLFAHPQNAKAEGPDSFFGGIQIGALFPSDSNAKKIMGNNVPVGGLELGYESKDGFRFSVGLDYYSQKETPIVYGYVQNATGQITDLEFQFRIAKMFNLGTDWDFYLGPEFSSDSYTETGSSSIGNLSSSHSEVGYGAFAGLEKSVSKSLSAYLEFSIESVPITDSNGGAGKDLGGSTIMGGIRYKF